MNVNDDAVKPKRFTIYLLPELLERVRQSARINHRSVNAQIAWMIEQKLEEEQDITSNRK